MNIQEIVNKCGDECLRTVWLLSDELCKRRLNYRNRALLTQTSSLFLIAGLALSMLACVQRTPNENGGVLRERKIISRQNCATALKVACIGVIALAALLWLPLTINTISCFDPHSVIKINYDCMADCIAPYENQINSYFSQHLDLD